MVTLDGFEGVFSISAKTGFVENIKFGATIVVSGCLVSLCTIAFLRFFSPRSTQASKLLPPTAQSLLITDKSPITKPVLIEFMDYQCPPCKRLQPKLDDWVGKHSSDVTFIVRNYPLSIHPVARRAAEIAEYARNLGNFEETHRAILAETNLEQSTLDKFEKSLASQQASLAARSRAKKTVEEDLQVAQKLSLNGTPSLLLLFPNRKVYQIYSFDQADALIKQEVSSIAQR